ncbi:MAG: Crp/Fnr family transcriptional regulator [Myxococcales bacterium]|nr:Crp/Fnr family transcriptional regulator [Myxococcales bacterium]MCB9644172.1 Crp/Fnr family transcriptional regulator [Myxococcales bacterium]
MNAKGFQPRDLLSRVTLFEGISSEDLEPMIPLLRPKKCVRGQQVVEVNTPGQTLYLIAEGRVKVAISDSQGREVILSILHEGDFFGELSLLDQNPRSASVIALKSTLLYALEREDFMRCVDDNPRILHNVMQKLCERLRKADAVISDLVLLDVYGRVARYLLDLSKEQGQETEEGIMIPKLPSQQEIASMLGTSRETINRVLSELEKRGILERDGRTLRIISHASLDLELENKLGLA